MKREFGISILLTMMFTLFVSVASAQFNSDPQNSVIVGSTFNYKVDNNGNALDYTWSVVRNTGSGTMPTIATPNGIQTEITWESAGTYTVNLETEMQSGGCIIVKSFPVTVIDNNSILTFREDNIVGCANDVSGSTIFDLGLTATAGSQPWTIKYTVDGGSELTGTVNNGEELKIDHTFTNSAGDAPTIVAVEITSITDKYGVSVKKYADDSSVTFPITKNLVINQLPNTSEIQHD